MKESESVKSGITDEGEAEAAASVTVVGASVDVCVTMRVTACARESGSVRREMVRKVEGEGFGMLSSLKSEVVLVSKGDARRPCVDYFFAVILKLPRQCFNS